MIGAAPSDAPRGAARALDAQNPWPGLRSFGEDEGGFFFGREKETRELLDIVSRSTVSVLYGQSGLGKTSLLRAGLFGPLKASGHVPVWVRLDHGDAAPPLARQLLDTLMTALAEAGVEAPPPRDDESLWSYFHRQDCDFWGPRNRLMTPVIVLDQFEEMFTLGQRDAAAAARAEQFARELEALFEQRPPAALREHLDRYPEDASQYDLGREAVRFVISLREDYLPHLDAWRDRMPSMLARRYRLEQMSGTQALEVVQRGGASLVDAEVAREIVSFVATGGSVEHARVEPAILSVVCDELNLRRMKAGLPRITRALLSGERDRIIGDFYERSFEGIDDAARDWVEDELLTASGHRDRAAVEDARRAGVDPAQIARLVDRRVLHSDERNKVVWVEFTHDLLTEPAQASRNSRQQRQAEGVAAAREAEVRGKLRRSRIVTAVFGVMTVAMALGALWLKAALDETARERAGAVMAKALAEANAVESQQQRREAERQRQAALAANAGQRQAAAQAIEEAARAKVAQDEAQRSLATAESTALQLARQGVDELEAQWLNPGFDSAEFVHASVTKVETLERRFTGLPEMRALRQQALALAAAVHFGRSDETMCTKLVAQADALPVLAADRSEAATRATALRHLAGAQCLRLRARARESAARAELSQQAARQLPARSPFRQRLLVLGALSRGNADVLRFDFGAAQQALAVAQRAIDNPDSAPPPNAAELAGWKYMALALDGDIAPDVGQTVALRERARKVVMDLPPALREMPVWRDRRLQIDTDLAYAMSQQNRHADVDEMVEFSLAMVRDLLSGEPRHMGRRMAENRLQRLRAETLFKWERKKDGMAAVDEILAKSGRILEDEPGLAFNRYAFGAAAWMKSRYGDTEQEAQLLKAEQIMRDLKRDAPDYAEPTRSMAVVLNDLAGLQGKLAEKAGKDKATADRHFERAVQYFDLAMAQMDQLSISADRRQIADLATNIYYGLGTMRRQRGDAEGALAAFRQASARARAVPVTAQNQRERALAVAFPELYVARMQRTAGRNSEADETDRRSLASLNAVLDRSPERFDIADQIAWVHRMAASDQLEAGRIAEAIDSQTRAAETMVAAVRSNPLSKDADKELTDIHKWSNEHLAPKIPKTGADALLRKFDALKILSDPLAYLRPAQSRRTIAQLPLVQGEWEYMEPERLVSLLPVLEGEIAQHVKNGWTAQRARRLSLPFFVNTQLVEIDLIDKGNVDGTASMLLEGGRIAYRLSGRGIDLLTFAREHPLTLRTPAQASLFLRLHTAGLVTDDGGIRLVDSARELPWAPDARADEFTRAGRAIEPFEISLAPDGDWTAHATMLLGESLYKAKLVLTRSGRVTLQQGVSLASGLPLRTDRYRDNVRMQFETATSLQATITRRGELKDWKGAAEASQRLVEYLGRRAGTDADRITTLSGRHIGWSWYLLLAKQAKAALAAADAGLALRADNLFLQINRAHALLLLGRETEALDLYRKYIGKRVGNSQSRLWEDEILNDLKNIESVGLVDPRFETVRALMLAAKKPRAP